MPFVLFNAGSARAAQLFVEVADEPNERMTGLMHRECLAEDWGMLFAYGSPMTGTFWMKDTLVPLSIAWVDSEGTILEIEDMEPLTEDSHASPSPYQYTIEANQGWFQEHGVEAGDHVVLASALEN